MALNNNRWLNAAPKYMLVILSIVAISLLFPNSSRFKYEFRPNGIWGYDDLISPFDFGILKTQDELDAERSDAERNASPYYEYDGKIIQEVVKAFGTEFDKKLEAAKGTDLYSDVTVVPSKYRQFGEELIKTTYEQGVAEIAPAHRSLPPETVFQVVKGNTNSAITKQGLISLDKAEEVLGDALFDSGLAEAEFLIPVFSDILRPNVTYSKEMSEKFKDQSMTEIAETKGMVSRGTVIISKGETITDEKFRQLESYKQEFQKQVGGSNAGWFVFAGYLLLTTLIIGMLLLFLRFHTPEVYRSLPKMIAIFIWPVIFSFMVYLVENTGNLSSYLIPFCIVPIIINHFFNARLALFVHIVIILIASFLSSLGYEFTFLQLLAGIVAIFTNLRSGTLTGFFTSMVFIFLTYSAGFLGLSLIQEGGLSSVEWQTFGWLFLSSLLTMMAYALVPLLEKVFGFTTKITLSELSDMNLPLLRDLSLKAPGTLQHSLQVANLCEAASNAIGADTQLVKVAALYHDIGKMARPEYYIENQKGENPHKQISDLESAKIIIEHVTEGEKLAKKHRLPKVLLDFIMTHHGTTRVEWFYRNHCNANPDIEVDESVFRYPGPIPFTKEQTILMIADSVEAASKSLDKPTQEDIEKLVDGIIKGKIALGQLANSPLTFKELEICTKVFKSTLGSIHHVRVEYPELKKKGR